ncbi:MAG: hypothetical protein ACXWKM_13580 [Phenylobacterium sp.]
MSDAHHVTPPLLTPRAVRHFGLAAMEARAARTKDLARPRPPSPRPLQPAAPVRRTVIRLWLPLTPIFLLLSPFAILLSPLIWLAPPAYRANPLATVLVVGRMLLSLGGTEVDVDTREARVHIRIF